MRNKNTMFRVCSFLTLVVFIPVAQCSTDINTVNQNPQNPIHVMGKDSIINRKPAVAGAFYPLSRDELVLQLDKLFSTGTPGKKLQNVVAIISPHAGYVYSGIVAASAFNQLSPEKIYENIFIIGSSHHASFDGAALYSEGNFITPLGIAKVNLPLTQKLIKDNPQIFKSLPEVQAKEHSLEVQLPFLQHLYKEKLQIVPIVIAANRTSTIRKIAEALSPYFLGNNLFVISTDFSHYPDYESACTVDDLTAKAIINNSASAFIKVLDENAEKEIHNLATSICGWTSVLTLLNITEKIGDIRYHEINYMNSGDVPYGDKERVVGYHAIAVTYNSNDTARNDEKAQDKFSLSGQEKAVLLRIARVTIENFLNTGKIPDADPSGITDNLKIQAGAFVTLTKEGKLRGCIGQFQSDKPLYKTIQELAVSSATRDYRFAKVTLDELDELDIEISVLTPLHKIQSIGEIELGRHGIYIKKDGKSGTFLPQVATQTGWDIENFLGHCSRDKAGIGWDGWKDAEIFTYEAYIFGEH